MKKSLILLSTLFVLFVTSCKKNSIEEIQPASPSFQLSFDKTGLDLSLAKAEVTLTNKTNGIVLKAKTDNKGLVNFNKITPGSYSLVANLLVSAAEYMDATGVYTVDAVSFSGSLEVSITSSSQLMPVVLKAGRLGNWVIKQVYYGGSSVTNGATFRDQFIELYNNSNEVLYADSLCFSQVHGKSTKVSSIDVTKPAFLPSGQFNWTKSIGINNANANTDYVYAKTMFMIPGTGKQYPVQPGASIIIAQNAQNHKTPYTGADGISVSVKDPSLTVDLSKAEFEAYLGNVPGINPLASDVDNPQVPNLVVLLSGGNRDLVLNSNGYEGIVIFKTNKNPLEQWKSYPDPETVAIINTTSFYTQIPVSEIIDGVDIAHTIASSRAAKRIPDAIDAGFTFTIGGSYSSQSIIRKTNKIIENRRVLKDSNNSSADFDYLLMADVSKSVFK